MLTGVRHSSITSLRSSAILTWNPIVPLRASPSVTREPANADVAMRRTRQRRSLSVVASERASGPVRSAGRDVTPPQMLPTGVSPDVHLAGREDLGFRPTVVMLTTTRQSLTDSWRAADGSDILLRTSLIYVFPSHKHKSLQVELVARRGSTLGQGGTCPPRFTCCPPPPDSKAS